MTAMPRGPSSSAIGRVRPMLACFELQEARNSPAAVRPETEAGWRIGLPELVSMIPLLVITATPGAVLIAMSRPLAARFCPVADGEGSVAPSRDEAARLGLMLLALYFVIEGLAGLFNAGLLRLTIDMPTLTSRVMAQGAAYALIGGLFLLAVPRLANMLNRS